MLLPSAELLFRQLIPTAGLKHWPAHSGDLERQAVQNPSGTPNDCWAQQDANTRRTDGT